jgi:predicted permease
MLDRLKAFIRTLRTRGRLGADMDDEMRFHIDQYRQDLISQGMAPSEAAWRARQAFGNVVRTQENCREAKGLPVLDELTRNTVYAFRQLRRSPGFAAAVVLTLAICIGVNTAVFSVIDAALLRALPFPQPDRIFDVVRQYHGEAGFFSSTGQDGFAWEAIKDARTMQVAALGGITGVNLAEGNHAFYVEQQRVSIRYFAVLGIPLARGREFEPAEDRAGGPDVVILSYPVWARFFNRDPSIVGHNILLRGTPYTVIGVTSESFVPRAQVDVWTPLKPSTKGEGGGTNYDMIARLNPGVTLAEAQTEVGSHSAEAFARGQIRASLHPRLAIEPFEKANQDGLRNRLMILWAAVALVLLIGCVNIAALLLARGQTRRREMGTRIALGGGLGPMIRQLITEALALGLIGGIAGVAIGYIAIQVLQSVTADYGIWQVLRLDGRVLLATAVLTCFVSVLFGLAPALQATRVDVRTTLLEGGSRGVAGGGSHWMRRALVLTEVALSLILLVGAGLLVRTLLHLQHLDPGFDGTNVLTATASMEDARYREKDQINRLFQDTLQGIRAIPGVQAAAVGLHLPYQRWVNSGVNVRGGAESPVVQVMTSMNYVTPGYFEALHIQMRSGRAFDDHDSENATPVALVNETFARKYLKNYDPLDSFLMNTAGPRHIVGVVPDLQQQPGLEVTGPIVQEPAVYLPATQFSTGNFQMVHTWYAPSWIVRSAGKREDVARAVEQAIASVDPMLPVAHFRSLVDERNTALKSQRSNAWMFGLLAVLAMALALVGVYGIVANSVAERTREFGIRTALGSSLISVIRDALLPGVVLSVSGVVIGGAIAAASVKVIKGLLYGVQPIDPLTFLLVGAALITVSALASLLPALTLVRLEPSSVLRQD